jgi:flagellar biosynthesis/type III secretory pathway protein FliH
VSIWIAKIGLEGLLQERKKERKEERKKERKKGRKEGRKEGRREGRKETKTPLSWEGVGSQEWVWEELGG